MPNGDVPLLSAADTSTLLGLTHDPETIGRAARVALRRLPLDEAAARAAGVALRTSTADMPQAGFAIVPGAAVDAQLDEARRLIRLQRMEPAAEDSALVTALVRVIVDGDEWSAGMAVRRLALAIADAAGRFRPDLEGLLGLYVLLLERTGPPGRRLNAALELPGEITGLRRGVAWIISRGGPHALLRELDARLRDPDPPVRLAAACLVAEAAPLFALPHPDPWPVPLVATRSVPDRHPPVAPPASTPTTTDEDVQFTVYRPGEVRPERWYPLIAFAHRTTPFLDPDGARVDPMAEVDRQARALLGAQMQSFSSVGVDSAAALPRGYEIVFEPWLESGEINPPRSVVRWQEPVHRMEFRLRVPRSAAGRRLTGGMRVYLGVLLIGEVSFAIRADPAAPTKAPTEPASARPYRRIFASYSHQDAEIVRRIADAAAVLGDRYLIDSRDLGSGVDWWEELTRLITSADIFQLFWSHNAMRSTHVRDEWEHALSLGREHFIRPVYWEEPLPATAELPPAALRRYHFCRLTPGPPAHAPAPPRTSRNRSPPARSS